MPSPQFAEAKRRIQQAIETKATALDLSALALMTLPPELRNLTNLTKLYLDQNQLTTLPPEWV
ncbi:MAG: leucine-rich repeat domain-containing protein [Phormidesmis sp.]